MSLESTTDSGGGRVAQSFKWWAAGLTLLHVVLAFLVFEPTLFPGGDNAGYLILADALRSGEGYRDLYLPGAPLHAKYPPVFPAILALSTAIGGVQLSKVAMLLCSAGTVWVTAYLGRSTVGHIPALLAAGFLAVNPTLLEYSHYLLSEAPFVLFVVLALWAAQKDDGKGMALALLAAAAAFLTRTAGLTVLIALPLAWLVRREWKRAGLGAAAAGVVLVAWGSYQAAAAPEQASYLQELVLVDPYTPDAGALGLSGLIVRAATNLWTYASRVISETAIGVGTAPFATVVGLLLAGLALSAWATRARRSPGALELFVLLYAGLIAIWPAVWTDRRFLLPLLPVMALLAFSALERLPRGAGRWAPGVLALGLYLPSLAWVADQTPERVRCAALYRTGAPCDRPELASFYAAARWAEANTPPDAIISNRKPRLFYWYSRRQGDLYPYSSEPDVVLAGLDRMGADYVVVDQVSATTARYLWPTIQAYQSRFELVYQGGEPPTYIFRLRPAEASAQ